MNAPRRITQASDAPRLEHTLKVTTRPISWFKPNSGNPRTHSAKQIRQLADAIKQFGFTNPVLTDGAGSVIAGHGRLAAAKLLNMPSVPAICLSEMTDADKRAYILADNKLATLSGWDRSLLAIEFEAIVALDPAFDVALTGFEVEEIDLILDVAAGQAPIDEAPLPAPAGPAVSRPGDLWKCSDHLLFCGDALDWSSYSVLIRRSAAALVLTDFPFNVPIQGHVTSNNRRPRREFVQASGEMSEAEFTRFLEKAMTNMARASKPGSLHYLFMDWRHLFELLSAGRAVFDELKNLIVWNKGVGGMGSLYRSQHELIALFKKAGGPHVNNVMLGKNGRDRTNVWDFSGMNSFSAERAEALALHPTVKPVAMIADAILDASRRGDLILDPFGGSGTTMLAAEQTGRRARLMELDPLYCDVILRRFQAKTGIEPVLASSNEPFAAVAEARTVEVDHG